MNRINLKKDAKIKMYKNYGFLIIFFIVSILLSSQITLLKKIWNPSLIKSIVIFTALSCLELSIANVYFKVSKYGKASIKDIIEPFKENLIDKILTIFLRNFYLVLWTILFIVPGIVKLFSYSQVVLILVDDEQKIFGNEAITKSRKIMDGKKFDLLVLIISFTLWFIASGLTGGILLIYVYPYFMITLSNFYLTLVGGNIEERVENAKQIN